MSMIDETWQALADGTQQTVRDPHLLKMVLVRIRNTAGSEDEGGRLQALAVVRMLGTADALRAAEAYVRDPSLGLRRRLLGTASELGQDGLFIVRRMCTDPDPAVAIDAIRRLVDLRDRAATSKVRGLLSADHAVVRNRAAVFLGLFGGPSLVTLLSRHRDDEDQGVREAVAWAIDTIEGATQAGPPEMGQSWAGTIAGVLAEAAASASPADRAPATPAAQDGEVEAVEEVEADPVPEPTSMTPPPPVEPEPPDEPDGSVLALMRALAVHPDRHDALLRQLATADERELSEAFRARKPGQHPDLNVGAAVAAAGLGNPRWLSPIRRLTSDPAPRVRAAVAEALGVLCTPAVYRNLEGLAQDADPKVQAVALAALARGALALRYEPQARRLITSLPETTDDALSAARQAALDALGAD